MIALQENEIEPYEAVIDALLSLSRSILAALNRLDRDNDELVKLVKDLAYKQIITRRFDAIVKDW